MRSAKRHVCFTPKSGHVRCNQGCPLWAKSGHGPGPREGDRDIVVNAAPCKEKQSSHGWHLSRCAARQEQVARKKTRTGATRDYACTRVQCRAPLLRPKQAK